MHRLILATVIAFCLQPSANADLIYRFSGGVDSSSDESLIALSETWTANFLIDPTAGGSGPDANGVFNFANAILSADIEFSGGITREFNPASAPARVGVGDNIFGGGFDFVDAEIGDFGDTMVESLYASVLTTDTTTLDSSTLFGGGKSFAGFGGMDFRYEASAGVFETVTLSGPMSFASVPEPGSFGLLSLFAVGFVSRRRRRACGIGGM